MFLSVENLAKIDRYGSVSLPNWLFTRQITFVARDTSIHLTSSFSLFLVRSVDYVSLLPVLLSHDYCFAQRNESLYRYIDAVHPVQDDDHIRIEEYV